MNYLERLNELAIGKEIDSFYQLQKLVKELELEEFKKAFFTLGKDYVDLENKSEQPSITFNGYDEPMQVRVIGVRRESDTTILIVIDSFSGDYDAVHLCDVEIGHLDFLIDYLK